MRQHYSEVEIKANDVEHPLVGKASLEATMHSIDLTGLVVADRTRCEAAGRQAGEPHHRRLRRISAGSWASPTCWSRRRPRDTNDATGGTTESGISDSHGLVFTGTPTAADFDKRVSVSVDLSMTGADQTTLVFTATGVLTGPGTADQEVPDDKKQAVLAAFRSALPDQKLPFGVAPTSEGARGSDVIIEGITDGVTITLDGFRQS